MALLIAALFETGDFSMFKRRPDFRLWTVFHVFHPVGFDGGNLILIKAAVPTQRHSAPIVTEKGRHAMSQHTPNELTEIFKRDRDLLTRLKADDRHYARLADQYHEVNREVHRIEAETEAASDEHTETLKKQRLALLDEITGIITNARGVSA
jgi:uncharacterized protein YdcH (DUF465 family)